MSHVPRTNTKFKAEEANSAGKIPHVANDHSPLRQKDMLTLNQRRALRVLMRVRIRVSNHGTDASKFDEQTHTLAVNAHGASILLSASVKNGQRINLVNEATGDKAECMIAYVGQRHEGRMEVGVCFVVPNPKFWHVTFPPHDWTPVGAEGY
jgi:hypothetical protein